MARVHSREFKLEVCRQIDGKEKRPSEIMREHNLVDSVLSRWRKEYALRGDLAFSPIQECELTTRQKQDKKIAELEHKIAQLNLEIMLNKKLTALLEAKHGKR